MVQDKFETGMYIIDKDFTIINLNKTMQELYPTVKVGDTCYKSIALQECQCPVCPLLQDDALFYNPLRKEWISANAAVIDYPGCGECYNVQFHIRHNISAAPQEELQEENMDEHIIELSGGTLDACAIGSYVEPGAPLSYVNDRMVRLMGYDSLEEMKHAVDGMVFNTIHPEDVEHVAVDLTECGLNGGYFESTYRLRRKDNSWLWVVARGKRVQLSSGVYTLFSVITDMTEFVQRQNELKLENEALVQRSVAAQAAMTDMPSGYHRCSNLPGYPFVFVSKSFEQLVGYTRDQLRTELDNRFVSLVLPEDMPLLAQFERDIAQQGTGNIIYRIRRRDGEIRWIQDSAMAIEWDGKPCLQCTAADITDFVNQQSEFARQKAEFDMAAESIPCGYHRCTVDNGFHLEFVSDDFLRIVGYTSRDELLGKRYLEFIAPEDRELFMSHEDVLVRDGKVELVYRIRRKDGSYRWVKDSTMRINYGGKDTYQVVLSDINEYVEGLNEARSLAEASSQAKSVFLFNASHDIRTPMNAIRGFSHIIRSNAHNPELVIENVEKLQRSGDILLTLMDDVLELSRIEQGKEEVNLRPLNMKNHVDKLYEMMAQEMAQSGITFRSECRIAHPMVSADELKLTRIAMNYLSNAKKFTPAGGTVTFGVVESDYDGKRATYTLFVEDTGIGMSREFQKHAFEQFEREHTSTASGVSGSGLGLSITKKLAALVGGVCGVESELGKGTRMTCSVSMALVEENTAEPAAVFAGVDFTGMRILLVEDNEFNREIARYVFEDVGFQVEDAVNGVECLEKLTTSPDGYYDFVLMDIQMPIMDGYTATREIRRHENPAVSELPIIAMTANAFEEDKRRCMEAGMNGHISKPMDAKAVLQELTRILGEGGGRQ